MPLLPPLANAASEDFPRGGASGLDPLELREVMDQAKHDVLFEESQEALAATRPPGKRKRPVDAEPGVAKLKTKTPGGLKSQKAKAARDHAPPVHISFKSLAVGSLLLGAIREINELDLVVSLPNHLTGSVSITEISDGVTRAVKKVAGAQDDDDSDKSSDDEAANQSDEEDSDLLELGSMFAVGQLLPLSIVSLEPSEDSGKRRIELSAHPKVVNAAVSMADILPGLTLVGEVLSEEDHGYLLSFGILDVTGFLPLAAASTPLTPGALVHVSIVETEGQTATCTLFNPTSRIHSFAHTTLTSLTPGMLVKAKVKTILPEGLEVSFMGLFTGTIAADHLGIPDLDPGQDNLAAHFTVGGSLKARIVALSAPGAHQASCSLSCLPHLLSMTPFAFPASCDIGAFVQCKVTAAHSAIGRLLECKPLAPMDGASASAERMPGYIHISKFSDDRTEAIDKKYRLGTHHKGRVVQLDPLDGLLEVSFQKSALERVFFRLQDLAVGQVVRGHVLRLESFGLLVSLEKDAKVSGLKCLIRPLHYADIALKFPEKKFKEGSKIKVRILSVDLKRKRCHATAKKSLVESALEWPNSWGANSPDDGPALLSSRVPVRIGMRCHATIVNVIERGALVELPNNIRGWCPLSEICDEYIQDARKVVATGQPKQIMITHVDADEQKLRVSFKSIPSPSVMGRAPGGTTTDSPALTNIIPVGTVLNATIEAVVPGDKATLYMAFDGGRGMIVKAHLSDVDTLNDQVFAASKVGDKMQVMTLAPPHAASGTYPLTSKPLLLKSANLSTEELVVGKLVPGYIKAILEHGVLVGLPGFGALRAVAYVRKAQISDGLVTRIPDAVQYDQSVLVRLLEVSEDPTHDASYDGSAAMQRFKLLATMKKSQTTDAASAPPSNPALTTGSTKALATSDPVEFRNRRLIKNPSDPSIKCFGDLTQGRIVIARVRSIKDCQVNMALGDNVFGRIHVSQVIDPPTAPQSPTEAAPNPLKAFKTNSVVKCRIIGFHDIKSHAYLPITHTNPASNTAIELSVRPSILAADPFVAASPPLNTLHDVKVDQVVVAYVQRVTPAMIWVHLSPHLMGRIHVLEVTDTDLGLVKNLAKHFTQGKPVMCKVVGKNEQRQFLDLSIKALVHDTARTIHALVPGQNMICQVSPPLKGRNGLSVQLGGRLYGRVHLTDISDVYTEDPCAPFADAAGSPFVQCQILAVDLARESVAVSLRKSRVDPASFDAAALPPAQRKWYQPELKAFADVQPDTVVLGYVTAIADSGVWVSLSHSITAHVRITDISDTFIKEWKTSLAIGQLVRGLVMAVNPARQQIDMTLKASIVSPDPSAVPLTLETIKKGDKVRGTVKTILACGVIIQITGSHLSGLCHTSEVSDNPVKDLSKLYSVGDLVKAVIIKVDTKTKRVSFGLKASYFTAQDQEDSQDEGQEEADEAGDVDMIEADAADESDDESGDDEPGSVGSGQSLAADDATLDTMMHEIDELVQDNETGVDYDSDASNADAPRPDLPDGSAVPLKPLDLGAGFDWQAPEENLAAPLSDADDDSDDSADLSDSERDKQSRRARKKAKLERERRIAQREKELLDTERTPEQAEDYERLLMGSPSSSFLWVKYMAFQLQMSEVGQARQVAERALKAIHFREEQEKMNIWVAYMNLENAFGTPDTLQKVFERAVSLNDPKRVFLHLAQIYQRTSKVDLAKDLFKTMLKRFNLSSKVWVEAGSFYLSQNNFQEARSILQRSLLSLPKRKHIKTITKFAQMEFKMGEPERGRTIFEGIMSNYPKRVDLWSVYLDMEIKTGKLDIVRRLFERVISMKFSTKKIKFFFKRYLEFEQKHGDETTVDHVKDLAMAYVERTT